MKVGTKVCEATSRVGAPAPRARSNLCAGGRQRPSPSPSPSPSPWPARAFTVRNDRNPLPTGIEEVKLWIDANLARTLGGGVVNTKGGPGGSGWARTYILELKSGGRLFAKLAKVGATSMFYP